MDDPRIYFAAERTLLAWIRTGLAMMGFGFVVARFGLFLREFAPPNQIAPPHPHPLSLWIGVTLVVLGVVVDVAAAFQYAWIVKRLRAGKDDVVPSPILTLSVAAILAAIGVVVAVYLGVAQR